VGDNSLFKMKIGLFGIVLGLGLMGLAPWVWGASPLKVSASTLLGYDNNARLNAERKEDGFGEETVTLVYKTPVSDAVKLRLRYDLVNVNYFNTSDEDVLWQEAGAGLDFDFLPKTTLETDYAFSYFYFHEDNLASSIKHTGRVGLRHRFSNRMSARTGFGVSTKGFEDRKLREGEGFLSDEERSDLRYTADSEVRVKVTDALILRPGFIFYRNDSDDQFHDYYDYNAYKFYTKAHLKLCPNLSASFKFSYERRDYDSRPVIDDANVIEEADVYIGSGGLFYKFHKNITLGAVYTYRQKNSNEPSQQYSSSITTLGLYYSF